MSTIDLSDFRAQAEQAEPTAPNFNYEINLVDGSTVKQSGYFVINSLFAAVCRGDEGIIYWAVPVADFKTVVNLGPVAEGTQIN